MRRCKEETHFPHAPGYASGLGEGVLVKGVWTRRWRREDCSELRCEEAGRGGVYAALGLLGIAECVGDGDGLRVMRVLSLKTFQGEDGSRWRMPVAW